MNRRVLVAGSLGGLLSAVVLAFPLYFILPASYVADWSTIPSTVGPFGYGVAALIAICTGYIGARWSWTPAGERRIQVGIAGGMLAGLVVFVFIGSGAAGVAGIAPLLRHGAKAAATDQAMLELLANSVVGITWWTYLALLGLVSAGALLGGVGGAIAAGEASGGWGSAPRQMHIGVLQSAAATLLLATVLSLIVLSAMFTLQLQTINESVQNANFTTALPATGVLDWPLGVNLVVLLGAVNWNWQQIARTWRHSKTRDRARARISAFLTFVIPAAALVLCPTISPGLLFNPIFLVGALAVWVINVSGIWQVRLSKAVAVRDGRAEAFSMQDALDFVLLHWLVVVVQVMIGATAVALSTVFGVIPFVSILSPESLMPSPQFSVGATIQSMYSLPVLVALGIAAVLLVSLPFFWIYLQWMRGKQEGGLPQAI